MTFLHYGDPMLAIYLGDVRDVLAAMEPESVHCVVTSPPYFGLRDYGIPPSVWGGDPDHRHVWPTPATVTVDNGDKRRWNHAVNGRGEEQPEAKRIERQSTSVALGAFCECGAWLGALGLEPDPLLYVEHVVEVMRAVRRVLRSDGTVWLNLGDSYAVSGGARTYGSTDDAVGRGDAPGGPRRAAPGHKPKDRMMIPARVAIALQADGWWLRDEIVWHKPNPMPSSVTDRTTPAHEMVYLLTKSARYAYDADAIREPAVSPREELLRFESRPDVGHPSGRPDRRRNGARVKVPGGWDIQPGAHGTVHRNGRTAATYRESSLPGNVNASTERTRVGLNGRWDESEASGTAPCRRNKRSVWRIATQPYPEAHFATFPEKLVEPMILAGTSERGVCLECGAPWSRVVERETNPSKWAADDDVRGWANTHQKTSNAQSSKSMHRNGSDVQGPPPKTTGWRATCTHLADVVPATVLDPFGGSGTVAMVANRLGRKAVYIDLSPKYADQAIKRIARSRASGEGPAIDMPVAFADDGLWA